MPNLNTALCYMYGPLVYMYNMTKQNSRILCTWYDLSEYDFQIIYRAGRENIIADALSRLPSDGDSLDMPSEVFILPEGLQVLCFVPGGIGFLWWIVCFRCFSIMLCNTMLHLLFQMIPTNYEGNWLKT